MNKQLFLVIPALAGMVTIYAQQDSVTVWQPVTEVIVTANKFEEKSRYVAQKVAVMDSAAISASLSNTTAGLLKEASWGAAVPCCAASKPVVSCWS